MTLRETFETLRGRDELAFMPYQTAGFPTLEKSVENLRVLGEHGADLLELGIPFSDPIADGPTIQYSSHVALENGTRLKDVLAALREFELPCPLVMMSYLNPLMAYGEERLFADMRAARINGLIVPDLALEEADEWLAAAREHGISIVFLLAPTSTDERIRRTAELTDDFIYAVSLTGTTGARRVVRRVAGVFEANQGGNGQADRRRFRDLHARARTCPARARRRGRRRQPDHRCHSAWRRMDRAGGVAEGRHTLARASRPRPKESDPCWS